MGVRISALLTCYNRKATTTASLARLFEQSLPAQTELTVFLVDDGSTDGTADAVRAQFPQVRLLRGDGTLFWNGGMRRAFGAALQEDFDFYLWLNDDTVLDPDAIARLLAAHCLVANGRPAVVVGSTRDPVSGAHTYGGVVRTSRLHPVKYGLVSPGDRPQLCETMNGNCVLIPRAVAAVTHNLSAEFRHGMGDFDYGLRARQAGCSIWIAPGYVGSCARNSMSGGFRDTQLPLRARWRHIMSRKGLPPGEYLPYVRRHGGPLWPVYWVLPYVRVIFTSLFARWHPDAGRG